MKKHSIKKSSSIFLHGCKVYNKKKNTLSDSLKQEFEQTLELLREAIGSKDKERATRHSLHIEHLLKKHLPTSKYIKSIQSFSMLMVALFFAVIIRQTCFELMQVPTGSMRPAFRESDRLVVSKGHFGINVPLTPKHITFSPEEMKRGGTVVITGENLDTEGVNTTIFYVLPAVKKFLKRTIGLPEDRLYFYGGKIYGIDKDGNNISHELQQDILSHLEHIPFINIHGRMSNLGYTPHSYMQSVDILQNHQKIARFNSNFHGQVKGKMLVSGINDIHELWGMGNYAMVKILPKDKIVFKEGAAEIIAENPNASHFLQITHHSSIHGAKELFDARGIRRPNPAYSVSFIPLNDAIFKAIWKNLYTARFNAKKGYLEHFGQTYSSAAFLKDRPKIKGGLEDGCYEFFDGIAYKVRGQFHPFGLLPSLAIPQEVNKNSPLANYTKEKCITLYNTGIEQSKFYVNGDHLGIAPARYGYFRDGDFYLMGKKIIDKQDPVLQAFVAKEKKKEIESTHYTPFIDSGAPLLADGSIDKELITKYGLYIPKKNYYLLGDNHAQSSDSREFGFVPEDNIRGIISMLLWAPGGRAGYPLQIQYKWFTIHKVIVWSLLFAGIGLYYYIERRKRNILINTPVNELLDKIDKQPLWKL